jgi:PAS domain S-box-containing protein
MRATRPDKGARAAAYFFALVVVVAAEFVARRLEILLQLPDPALIFLTAVLLSAVLGGLGPALLASAASFLGYNYFFVEPRYTLDVTKPQDLVSLFVFLAVAVLTSHLMARAREQAEIAERGKERMAALYGFSRDIATASGIDNLLPIIAGHFGALFNTRAVLLMPDAGQLVVRAAYPLGTELPEREREAAAWAWLQGGSGDAAFGMGSESEDAWLHLSLGTARGEAAVLALDLPDAKNRLSRDQFELLDALSQQAALAIERCRIDVVLSEKATTEQVIEASEDGIFVLDGEDRVRHVNDVACAILGIERAQAIDKPFEELASTAPHYLRVRETVREFRAHPESANERLEITVFLRGRDHHYVLRLTPFRTSEGAPSGFILALQDVTYIRDQEARRENLVATLSHELRTPLTSLRMAVEMLRERQSELSADSKELVETLHEDVLRLQDVSQQFLDLARTRAMAIGVQRRPFDMHELIARMLRLFSIQAREKGVALETSEDLLPSMMGDETKLSWALSNLIANAIRYTPAGGTVRVETLARDHGVTVAVSDSGPGIAPDEQGRIFERYAQGSGDGGAAGLGLAIVRDIVQAHGGRIHLQSALGKGTRFTLDLPSE